MKVIFAGTPEFAAVALQSLHEAGFEIPLVLTQPDRPAGRGMHLQPSAVKQYAVAHGIEVLHPLSLRTDSKDPLRAEQALAAHARLLSTPYDVMVVAAYGLILPRTTLDIKPCLNIHGSLLPRWRGAAPIHRAIEAGDTETGITIMEMEEGLDTGPMLLIERIAIGEQDTTGVVHDKLAALGGKMIVEALRKMEHNQLEAVVQPEEGVNYAAKISKEEAALDFAQSASSWPQDSRLQSLPRRARQRQRRQHQAVGGRGGRRRQPSSRRQGADSRRATRHRRGMRRRRFAAPDRTAKAWRQASARRRVH
jgi:methionyl-tRNA formyltransferase